MTTTVDVADDCEPIAVPIPDGWHRVWSGPVRPGDRHLNLVRARRGDIQWIPISFADLIEYGANGMYDYAGWYECLIREIDREVGRPCIQCGIRPPVIDCDCCFRC